MTDERITAYLLNELSEREAEEFEDECFAQPEWPEVELESAEQDLIQAYVKRELSAEQRQRFEENYLTTAAREERLLITRSLLRVTCSGAVGPQPSTWWQKVGAFLKLQAVTPSALIPKLAVLVLTIGLAVVLALLIFRPTAPQTFASLSLVSTSDTRSDTRSPSGPVKKLTLPLAEDAVRISLQLADRIPEGSTFRVQWEDIKGPLEDLKVEKADTNSITVIIPSEKLKRGQYTLKLYRKNPDGTEQRVSGNYHFDVE